MAEKGNRTGWAHGFFDCCSPGGLCLKTFFCPCIVYGKSQARLHNKLDNYSCCNGSCCLFAVLFHLGCQCIPATMQRGAIRERHNLEGGGFGDFCKSCWCTCCVLMQNEKELEQRESLLRGSTQGYQPNDGMVYPQGN
ncbi:PLAC8 family domain-containing protein [Trichoderma austrokoningii]